MKGHDFLIISRLTFNKKTALLFIILIFCFFTRFDLPLRTIFLLLFKFLFLVSPSKKTVHYLTGLNDWCLRDLSLLARRGVLGLLWEICCCSGTGSLSRNLLLGELEVLCREIYQRKLLCSMDG